MKRAEDQTRFTVSARDEARHVGALWTRDEDEYWVLLQVIQERFERRLNNEGAR